MSNEALYDIILTGKLEPGFSQAEVRFQLADLFKVEPEKIASVLANAPQVIRRGVAQSVAERYVDAIRRCGAQAELECKTATEEKRATETPPQIESPPTPPPAPNHVNTAENSWSLSAPGTDLLKPEERKQVTPTQVNTEHLQLLPPSPLESKPAVVPPPPATEHLSVAAPGEDLLVLKPLVKRANIGDLSHLDILPPGSDLLRDEERKHVTAETPDISYLSLQ